MMTLEEIKDQIKILNLAVKELERIKSSKEAPKQGDFIKLDYDKSLRIALFDEHGDLTVYSTCHGRLNPQSAKLNAYTKTGINLTTFLDGGKPGSAERKISYA